VSLINLNEHISQVDCVDFPRRPNSEG